MGTEPIFSRPSPVGDISYTPGRGLQVGDTGLTLGGYTDLVATRNEGEDAQFTLQDLSFLILLRLTERLHVFSELEIEDVLEVAADGHVGNPDDRFTVERLYLDYNGADAFSVRGGTFLTPVGRWNPRHAAPLVWTTSRPLVTKRPFDPNATGAMLYGSFFPDAGWVSYALYGQFAGLPAGNPPFEPANYAAGARFEFTPISNLSLGASYRAAQKFGRWSHLGGVDGLWQWSWLEVQGEAVVEEGRPGAQQWGLYLQAAVELVPRLYLVERYEYYDGPKPGVANLIASGLLYRLLSNTVFKIEYLAQASRSPYGVPGVKASLAVLF
ncbi:MAG TPA: hypothetical protein VNO26_13160 [Candidatus Limnocylindria bacterium]|nr:hypothetical protein [Candidatus Limnocylindria bacterium]